MTTVSVLELMPSTGEQIASFASDIKMRILSGEVDFRRILEQKAFIERTISAIFDDVEVKEHIQTEVEKYGKEGVGYEHFKFEIGRRKSWTYDQTGDSKISEMMETKKTIEQDIKDRQRFLQSLKHAVADPETGEMIYPAAFKETTYIKTSEIKK